MAAIVADRARSRYADRPGVSQTFPNVRVRGRAAARRLAGGVQD